MWHEIVTSEDAREFMERIYHFHDSCIKEMRFVSGAYVTDDLSMYPINEKRSLSVIIQRQFSDMPVLELEFGGLDHMYLRPVSPKYTCEILDATLVVKDDRIWWCDCGGIAAEELERYDGTLICSEKFRWRAL